MKWIFMLALFLASAASASELGEPTTSTAQTPGLEPLGIFGTVATLTPYFGTLGFEAGDGSYQIHGLAGFTADLYLAEVDPMRPELQYGRILYGIESGLMYATIGGSQYALLLPIVLKGTTRIGPRVWLEGMLGAEFLYRSRNDSMQVGRGTFDGNNSTEAFPELGASLAWKASRFIALSLRAEYIPTPADDLFTAAAGIVIPIG